MKKGKGVEFEGQNEGEKVVFVFRRHILTARRGLVFLLVCIVLGFLPVLIWNSNPSMIFVFLGAMAIGIIGAVYAYLLWYFSIYIVTNERIRQVAQRGFLNRTVIDLWLDRIVSVSCRVKGFGSIFNYGTIMINTTAGELVMSDISGAQMVADELSKIAKITINRGE
jgi:uncharacterized membrane protein YdbT with pleckstrin-like domain